MTRWIILLGLIIAVASGSYFGGRQIYRNIYQAGFIEAQRLAAIAAEQARAATQAKINSIEKQALDQIASQTTSNVERLLADAKRSNPACSLVLPRSVSDALRGPR